MKEIKLHSMHLLNWRGAKDRTANFGNCTETTISGHNGCGKSTFFDAFIWLLYGKDQFGRADYKITPVIDHVVMNRVDSTVSAELVIDGEIVTLERTYHPKWVRKTGATEETFGGYETRYSIDGAPCRQKDYNAKIEEIIDGTIFRMISNPLYFLQMKWKDQRDILFTIAGTVSDADLAAKDPNFAALLDRISGKPLDEYRKKVAAEKKKLNEGLKAIPAKIDQTRILMPEEPAEGWAAIEDAKAMVDESIRATDKAIANAVEANNTAYQNQRALLDGVNELKKKRDQIIRDYEAEGIREVQKYNHDQAEKARQANADRSAWITGRSLKQMNLADLQRNMKDIEANRDSTVEKIERAKAEKDALIADWKAAKAKEIEAKTDCVVCPIFAGKVCQDPDAAGRIEELNEKARQAFETSKANEIDDVNKAGKAKAEFIKHLEQSLADYTEAVRTNQEKIDALTKDIADLDQKINATAEVIPEQKNFQPVETNQIPGVADLNKQIADQEARANQVSTNVDTTDLQTAKAGFMKDRDELVKKLATRDQIEKGKKAIADLEDMSKKISQQIADLEKEEFTIADFIREKIAECERRVNNRFKMVDWKLFDYTIDGGEKETCYPVNKENGTPIDVTNTADMLNCGIDIVNTLSEFYGVCAPIFIDRRESVCDLIDTPSQIINLVVVKDQDLTITNK